MRIVSGACGDSGATENAAELRGTLSTQPLAFPVPLDAGEEDWELTGYSWSGSELLAAGEYRVCICRGPSISPPPSV